MPALGHVTVADVVIPPVLMVDSPESAKKNVKLLFLGVKTRFVRGYDFKKQISTSS